MQTSTQNVPLAILPSINHKQAYDVLAHLFDLGSISGLEAVALYRITSITKVVSILRNKYNWPITKVWKTDHTNKRYARYHLEVV